MAAGRLWNDTVATDCGSHGAPRAHTSSDDACARCAQVPSVDFTTRSQGSSWSGRAVARAGPTSEVECRKLGAGRRPARTAGSVALVRESRLDWLVSRVRRAACRVARPRLRHIGGGLRGGRAMARWVDGGTRRSGRRVRWRLDECAGALGEPARAVRVRTRCARGCGKRCKAIDVLRCGSWRCARYRLCGRHGAGAWCSSAGAVLRVRRAAGGTCARAARVV